MKSSRPILAFSLFAVCCSISPAYAENNIPSQSKEGSSASILKPEIGSAAQWQLDLASPVIETNVAALILQNKQGTDRIYVPDMDIVITKDNKRLIPLLRFLRLIEASGEVRNDLVVFKVEGGRLIPIDIVNKTLQVNDEKTPLDIEVGISDVTNAGEIYVSEEVLKRAFGFDFVWSAERFEYTVTAKRELEIFKRRRLSIASPLTSKVQRISESFPETEPPKRPTRPKPALSFFQTETRADARRYSSGNLKTYNATGLPALNVWGSALNGDYKVTLRNYLTYPFMKVPSPSSWVDRAFWASRNDNLIVNVGDTYIGFSDLVAPAVNLFGTSFKWLPGAGEKKALRDRFFNSPRPFFLSQETFDGYAPLGSDVELWINNRLVDSRTVEESDGAPPGYAYYRFDGIGLLNNSINDVRIVTKRENDIIEESRDEILAVNQLLPAGQLACIGGVGTRKRNVYGETMIGGEFFGLQVLYGVLKDLTICLTAATQDKFAVFKDEATGDYYKAPRRYYVAQEARARFFDHLFGKYNIGLSYDPAGYAPALAATADLEYYLRQARLRSQIFSYGPRYSNGVVSLSGKQGYSLSFDWKIFKNWLLKGGILHIFNNVVSGLMESREDNILTAGIAMPGPIPRSTFELQAGHSTRFSDFKGAEEGNIYAAKLDAALGDRFNVECYYAFGDMVNTSSRYYLTSDIYVPDLYSFYSYKARLKASWRASASHTISSTYWRSPWQDRLEVSSNYNKSGAHSWRSRFDIGTILKADKFYLKENFEFNLDKEGNNRIGINAGLGESGRQYDVGFYVSLQKMFDFNGGKIKDISRARIYPEQGGIHGFVYLDLNFNGHRDAGEPGVPNIAILVDGKECAESDGGGDFYISRSEGSDFVVVSLDPDTLPAIYTPTQGIQKAYWEKANFTAVNLGVCALGSVSGVIKLMEEGRFKENVIGARVILIPDGRTEPVSDSITAYDGSYYIGQIKPGDYVLRVDEASLPKTHQPEDGPKRIKITSGKTPHEIDNFDICMNYVKPEPVEEPQTEELEEKAKEPSVEKKAYGVGENFVLDELVIREKIWKLFMEIYNRYLLSIYPVYYKTRYTHELNLR